jgi:hypothetical protein
VLGSRNRPTTADRFTELVASTYAVSGAAAKFQLRTEEGEHEFFVEPTAEFFLRWL